jgi:hypothetical protein
VTVKCRPSDYIVVCEEAESRVKEPHVIYIIVCL